MTPQRRFLLRLVVASATLVALALTLGAVNYCDWKADLYFEPRVVRAGQTGTLKITVWFQPEATRAEISLFAGGPVIPMNKLPSGAWTAEVPMEKVLAGYQTGLGHNFFGYLDEYDGTTLAVKTNLVANVRDETMPDVPIRVVSTPMYQAQMTRHVLNLREDSEPFFRAGSISSAILSRFYMFARDEFDFLAVVGEGIAIENRFYLGLRNSTQGLGLASRDQGAAYGSANKLQGIVHYPNDNFFDLAQRGLSHEVGHRWCCFLQLPAVRAANPHWPMGDVATAVMGVTLSGGAGGDFPYKLIERPDGNYTAQMTDPGDEFSDLELYLIGLVPASEVAQHFVFNDQNQTPGPVMNGPVTRFTINDVIASAGPRVPAYGSAQTSFRLGTMVLSRNRLMEPHEMAFFEYMAARGEARTPLAALEGVRPYNAKPFYLSTRGKATLSTTVCSDCAGAATSVSAASYRRGAPLAPNSIASAFGFGLTSATGAPASLPLPTVMSETSVVLNERGGAGPDRPCSLFYISPGQINYALPDGIATGPATVRIVHKGVTVASGPVTVEPVAPALFTANSDGTGVPAALANRYSADNRITPVSVFQCGSTWGSCQPAPMDLGAATDNLYLELYGTGIRGRTSMSAVSATIGGVPAQVGYAGQQGVFVGLDQVNILVPRSLAGRGQVPLVLTVDGKTANTVTIAIR